MLKILFVCTGNICRSPIAEVPFRKLAVRRNLQLEIQGDSAATHGYHIGAFPEPRTPKNAEKQGINLTHPCRKLSGEDFSVVDYLVAKDDYYLKNIQSISTRSLGMKQSEETYFLY